MPTITLVDDDQNILTALGMFFETEGFQVKTYSSAPDGLKALVETPPDIAILDVKMPRMDGMELLRRLRQTSQLPVIFLTSKDEEIDELMGLDIGADDFVRKPCSNRLLAQRVKAILRRSQAGVGHEASDKTAIVRGDLTLDESQHACTWKGNAVRLTVTEFLILEALARRPAIVKTRDNLMDAAYEDQVYVDDRTIDSHVKRLRKKLRQHDPDFNAIETLYGVGYRYNM